MNAKRIKEQEIALKQLNISPEEIDGYEKDPDSLFDGLDAHEGDCQVIASTFFPEMVLSKRDVATVIYYYQGYCLERRDNLKIEHPNLLKVAEMIGAVKDVMIYSVERKLKKEGEQKIMDKLLSTEIGKRYVYQEMIYWCWDSISEGKGSIHFMQGLIKDNPKGRNYLIGIIKKDYKLWEAVSK